jgi:hypothetical protein
MGNGGGWFREVRSVISVLVLLMLVVSTQKMAMAQGSADGSIRGAITDPSGASVSGVTVTVTNNSTGTSKTQSTGDDGTFNSLNSECSGQRRQGDHG